jgi:hypothetical protein
MVCDVDTAALDAAAYLAAVTAEDIAALVVFLAVPGGRNISGQAIPVDGDQTSLG